MGLSRNSLISATRISGGRLTSLTFYARLCQQPNLPTYTGFCLVSTELHCLFQPSFWYLYGTYNSLIEPYECCSALFETLASAETPMRSVIFGKRKLEKPGSDLIGNDEAAANRTWDLTLLSPFTFNLNSTYLLPTLQLSPPPTPLPNVSRRMNVWEFLQLSCISTETSWNLASCGGLGCGH